MRTYPVLCLLLLSTLAVNAEPKIIPADDPRIAIMGRTELADGKVQMGFPGVTLRFDPHPLH